MERVNQWLSVVANAGVLVGIVFLAFEIRQNTEMMEAQTRDSMTGKQMQYAEWIATDDYLAKIMAKGMADGIVALSNDEAWSFTFALNGIWREWENSLYQQSLGLYTDDEFQPRVERWKRFMGFPGAREVWNRDKHTFSSQLRAQLDEILVSIENA